MNIFDFLFYCEPGVAQASTAIILGITGVAISAYGTAKNSKAAKAQDQNSDAFLKAQQMSEAEAREMYDGLIAKYNSSRAEVEGLSLKDFIGAQIEALGNPELKNRYYAARNEDWAVAQKWADEATTQNLSTFNRVVDEIGGGSYKNLVSARNNAILGDDVNQAYDRAAEIRNTRIPAGSVVRDADGNAEFGTRADRQEYSIAYEEILKSNDRIFDKSSKAINDDRTAAERQQVQGSAFLPFLDYAGFTNSAVVAPFNDAKLRSSLSVLSADASLAGAALGKAVQNPLPPGAIDVGAGNQLVSDGTKLAVAALGQYYTNNRGSSGTNVGAGGGGAGYSTSGGGGIYSGATASQIM